METMPPVTAQLYGAMVSAQPTMPVTVNGSPSMVSLSLSATPLPDGVVSATFGVRPAPTSTRSSVLPSVSHVSLLADGGSLMPLMVMVKVTGAVLSMPSESVTVTVALPNAFGAGVKESVPPALMDGCDAKSALLLLVTVNVSGCDSPGPAEMAVAHDAA
jgi:hypothetical protein